ncbi:replication protein A [Photorhabdus akhurstii]|uniref:Replication protein A n=1 Tax=Photorhabdus akhurstii TaxID=171438 RepID=A0ABX8M4X6_9GAMM|nr:replication protein A [Photorhabdus akhurstii]
MSELIDLLQEHNSDYQQSKRLQYEMFKPGLPGESTLAEQIMWQVNPDDYDWRHKIIGDMPDFLALYFATRYKKIFTQSGGNRRRANTFLRQFGENVLPRLNKVTERYQFKDQVSGVTPFPFIEQLERLVTLERKDIKQLAWGISHFMAENYENTSAQYVNQQPVSEQDARERLIRIYELLAKLTQQAGTTAPYWQQFTKGREGATVDQLCAGLLRMMSDKWWYARLKRMRDIRAEHMAIAVGQVQKSASPYVSRSTLREWLEQKRRNWDFIKQFDVENEQGDRVPLEDMVLGSVANPAVRRSELMVRMRGFENLADELGYVGEFYTITAPSKYHAVHSVGGFVSNWNGASPRDTQKYLCNVWAKIRAAYSRAGISAFGFRVVEPHHDGTPHWHMLLFMRPEHVDEMRDIMCYYARLEDSEELQGQKALKARFHVKSIDKAKGSATGYIAKYISKNIDGYALDGEKDGETGQLLKDMSRSVSAWASRWRIRQFQQIGGAPVSVWRELRRLSGDEQILSDVDMDNVRFAADVGDWFAYTEFQGGPLVARKDLTVRLSYEITEQGNAYGENVLRISGVYSPRLGDSSSFITRTVKWNIVPKFNADVKGVGLGFSGGFAASWSSVNNCTGCDSTARGGDLLVEKVIDYADSIGMDFSRAMAKSLIIGEKINVGEQSFKLWTDGSFIPIKTECQKQERRDVLWQRIKNIGEMRKNLS